MRLSARPIAALLAALALTAGLSVTGTPALARSDEGRAAAEASDVSIAADTYTWKNARIDGGGFVPGIVFNRSEKNLAYARTDIGGAYRWEEAGKTVDAAAGLGGLGRVGLDRGGEPRLRHRRAGQGVRRRRARTPTAGTRRTGPSCAPRTGARPGRRPTLPFKLGGNMPGRGHGRAARGRPEQEPRAVSGRAQRQGAVAVHRLRGHLVGGDRLPQPRQLRAGSVRHQRLRQRQPGHRLGHLRRVAPAARAAPRRTIYVGCRRQGEHRLPLDGRRAPPGPGSPASRPATSRTRAYSTRRTATSTSPTATRAARTTAARAGCGGTRPATGAWTDISPVAEADTYYGFSGLTVDRQKPGTLMATAYSSWWPDTQIFRSTDSGAHLDQGLGLHAAIPNRSNRYTHGRLVRRPGSAWGANPVAARDSARSWAG